MVYVWYIVLLQNSGIRSTVIIVPTLEEIRVPPSISPSLPASFPASLPPSIPKTPVSGQFCWVIVAQKFEVSEVFSFDYQLMSELEITEESIRDVQVVVTDQPSR